MHARSTAEYLQFVQEAADFVLTHLGPAKIALVLGSGLGPFVGYLTDTKQVDFHEVPHMPSTSVEGHQGKLILGTVSGKRILCLAGRIHPYEGYHMYQLTFMVRVMKRVGVELYVTTNSSGGCQPGMKQGCIMAIRDHMNWFHSNPLYELPDLSERHVDMRRVYSSRLLTVARRTAKSEAVQLFEGTAVTTCGPTYESFAEVKAGMRWGASAFGMSLVPEAVSAYSEGLEVFGCSMITNIAAGIDDSSMQLSHEDVIGVSGAFAPQFTKFMLAFISNVQTRPPRPLVLPPPLELDAAALQLLPQPQAAPATRDQVQRAVNFLVSRVSASFNLRDQMPEVAIYVSYGMENLPDYLRSQKMIGELVCVPFAELPMFPCISRSGRAGEICFGLPVDGRGASIVFLKGNALESYNCEEGVFVAQVLSQLGVQKIVHTFFAASTNAAVRADTVRIVGDATDYTTIAPVAHVFHQPQYMSTALFNTNASDLEDLLLAFRFAGQEDTSKPLHYAHILGPSFPTRAEVHLSLMCGIDLVGITSLSLVYAARSLGIDVVGIAGVSYEAGEDPLADASYVLWKKMRTVIVALLHGNFFPKHRTARDNEVRLQTPAAARKLVDEVMAVADAAPSSAAVVVDGDKHNHTHCIDRQVTYHLARPITQGLLADVQESAAFLRSEGFLMEADLAVVIDSRIPPLTFGLGKAISVPYGSIPKFPEHAEGTATWIVTADHKKLLVLHGTLLYNEGRSNAEVGHSVRVLQQLKVKRVVFVNEVASYTRQAPMDSFVLLRDHFNLAGRNPLFGKNVPEFGIRFNDLGNLYTDTMRQAVRRCAQHMDLTVTEATCAFVIGPVFASLADAAIITHACEAQVSCTGMVPEVIVARHAGIPLAAIGIVKTFIVPGDVRSSNKFRGRNSRNLVGLISNLLNRL